MNWKLDKERAICPQIAEQLCVKIALGELQDGEKLSSVREIALEAGVNPNTVQKAFEQLEDVGLIYSVRGSGWFVANNRVTAKNIVSNLIRNKTISYIYEMKALGLSLEETKKYVEEWGK